VRLELEPVGAEGVGLEDLGARLETLAVHLADELGELRFSSSKERFKKAPFA